MKNRVTNVDFSVDIDDIGIWSEFKLSILERYFKEYTKILSHQNYFKFYYIDAFAGAGIHLSKSKDRIIKGSPLKALEIEPPFHHYHFIDLDLDRVSFLKKQIGERKDVTIHQGDSNLELKKILPSIKHNEYKRAICLLDPYKKKNLHWETILLAGKMDTVEVFINFPIMDINRSIAIKNPDEISKKTMDDMDLFWGDHSWYNELFASTGDLFGKDIKYKKAIANNVLVKSFKKRLKKLAGYKYIPDPVPMKNGSNNTIYFLYFATNNKTAYKIVSHLFNKYKTEGKI